MSKVYTNKTDPYIYNEYITEWDIKSANVSLLDYYDLADNDTINRLRNMKKSQREVAVGIMCRNDHELMLKLEKAFDDIINKFIISNKLKDVDIISIKKDSVFVRNINIVNNVFGPVEFVNKNVYNGILLLPKYEFYYNPLKIDVKGINDKVLPLHKNGILKFIQNIMECGNRYLEVCAYLHDFIEYYKKRELDLDYYREFTTDSAYKVKIGDNLVYLDNIDESMLMNTDITYNFYNIILETIKIIIR